MATIVIGADGQLGSDLMTQFPPGEAVPLFYPEFDVTRPGDIRAVLSVLRPGVVINTSAFNRVDECEDHVEDAFRLNAFAVRDLALACRDAGAIFVHFSSDYVFDGRKGEPYVEDDPALPLNVYGASKLAGENFVRAISENHILIRTCGLYGLAGSRDKGRNFIEAMLALAATGRSIRVVDDQWVTPTATEELAARVIELLRRGRTGLYHLTNEGSCTWFTFARAIFEIIGRPADVIPIDSLAYGAKARRPVFSVLENRRAKDEGLTDFSPWREALGRYLVKKGLA